MPKNKKPLLMRVLPLMLLLIATSSCASKVTVYDQKVYGDLGEYGAHFTHTLTPETGDVDKETWDKIRVGMLCMDSQAFSDGESAVDQLCAIFKSCDYKARAQIKATLARVRAVVNRASYFRKQYRENLFRQTGEQLEE